jgi:tripartite-type tricarboxylate transporter receptor subunit TctC
MRLLSFVASLAVATVAASGALAADNYPSRPITLVVGFAPGGPTDTVARVLAERMKDSLKGAMVVENQTGAAGTIAGNRVAHADPDGYTLSVGQWTTNVGAVAVFPVKYDVLKDFEPISMLTISKLWIVARKDFPANNTKEFVAWLKANPGKGNAATVGVGSAAHVCLVDMQNRSKTKFQMISYRGGALAMQDLLSGQADFGCLEAGQTLTLVKAGKLKAIGVASKSRWFGAPEVPTLAEGGLAGVEIDFWHGLWAPKKTPKAIVAKLNAAVKDAFKDAKVKEHFAKIGHAIPEPELQTPKGLYAYHKAEIEKWWPIMKKAGIKLKATAPALAGSKNKK